MAPLAMEKIVETMEAQGRSIEAMQEVIKTFGRADAGAGALLARGNGRPTIDSDLGYQPSGKRWFKGVGMGDYLMALQKTWANPASPESEQLMKRFGSTKTALAESAGLAGGYTVPPEFAAKLLMLAFEDSIAMPSSTVIPMTSRTQLLPALDVTTRYASGTTPFLGGVVASWTEEAALRTETEPQFRQTELVARELSGYTVASNTLLQDNAVGLDALLSQLFTQAVSWYSDFAFIQGNGVGKPQGVLNSPATVFVTAATAGQVSYADVAGMFATLLPQSYKRAGWVISPTAIPYLLQLKDAADQNIFLPRTVNPVDGGPAQQEIVWKLLGLPVHVTEKMPPMVTGTAVKQGIMLVDWGLYLIGMRMEIEIAASVHFKFTNNQTVWRFVARLDGRPWLDNSVQLQDGSTVLSPFVGLINA
jgi:HK97 family phage major capsid protein